MYLEHFGLALMPFSLSPDSRFLWACASHQEALNTLLVAAKNREGFIKITGEVGLGKTLLCREFIHRLPESVLVIYLPNPYLSPAGLLRAIAEELELDLAPGISEHGLVSNITSCLLDLNLIEKQVILCLDEAQSIPKETLEALRLLTNLETETDKLLQVVLFGQPELERKLRGYSVRQLAQRITFQYRLRALTLSETRSYVLHRMLIAGVLRPVFTPNAVLLLHLASGGVPRLINILGHKAMLLGYGQGDYRVNGLAVWRSMLDTPATWRSSYRVRWALVAAFVSASVLFWCWR